MLRSKSFILAIFMLTLATLACALPGVTTIDTVGTTAAETMVAGLTQNVTNTFTSTNAATLTMTFTPTLIIPTGRPVTETQTPAPIETGASIFGTNTPSPTLGAFETFTATIVEMSVTRPTNCRTGPGKAYDIVGTLLVGKTVKVLGRDPTDNYYYIPNPDGLTEYCWVWGEYAVFTGSQFAMPAFTPPATPTSTATPIPSLSFKLKGSGMASCSGAWWMNIEITNFSKYTLGSVKIEMHDITKNVFRVVAYNDFPSTKGCGNLSISDNIPVEASVLVSGPKFDYNLRDSSLRGTITVCSEDELKGVCTTVTAPFNP